MRRVLMDTPYRPYVLHASAGARRPRTTGRTAMMSFKLDERLNTFEINSGEVQVGAAQNKEFERVVRWVAAGTEWTIPLKRR